MKNQSKTEKTVDGSHDEEDLDDRIRTDIDSDV